MILETIIAALRARCPTLGVNVGGSAEFKHLEESANLPIPSAYVIPMDDSPEDPMAINAVRQKLIDSFAVIVCLSNIVDEKGQGGMIGVRAMRTEIWHALLGWRPTNDYNGIHYEGGSLLKLDRARLWYQFEFGAQMEIGPDDGYEGTYVIGLPHLDGVTLKVDAISPQHDLNLAPAGQPDTRIENVVPVPKTGVLP